MGILLPGVTAGPAAETYKVVEHSEDAGAWDEGPAQQMQLFDILVVQISKSKFN